MRVLVACEFSGTVRDAFIARGHDAVSCDLLPTEKPGPHHQGDVRAILGDGWDLMVAHPECTYLTLSANGWFSDALKASPGILTGAARREARESAVAFVRQILDAPIPRIAVENPISVLSTRIGKPTQIIQPWQFGHGETKATCLWLRGLPPLRASDVVDGRQARIHHMSPSPDRWRDRSRTYPGIAAAMAAQWGDPAVAGVQLELL